MVDWHSLHVEERLALCASYLHWRLTELGDLSLPVTPDARERRENLNSALQRLRLAMDAAHIVSAPSHDQGQTHPPAQERDLLQDLPMPMPAQSAAKDASYASDAEFDSDMRSDSRDNSQQRDNGVTEMEGDYAPDAVEKRAVGIADNFGVHPLAAHEVATVLTTRAATAYTRTAEDDAFITLLRGYQSISQTEMTTFFSSFREDYFSDAQRVKLRAIDDVQESAQRLVVRHQTLEAMSGPTSWVRRLVSQMEVIRFAVEWNAMEGKGTNKMKTDFYTDVFLQCPAVATRREIIKKDARGKLPEEFTTTFQKWRRENESSVTGRNHLLNLYNLFGAGVLIDPAFDARILGRSRKFSDLLERVYQELDLHLETNIEDKLKELHEATAPVLLNLAQYLGSSQLRADVSAFIARYPPTFALRAKAK